MWLMSTLCRCFQDPEGKGRNTQDAIKVKALADSDQKPATKSSQDSPSRTLPAVSDPTFPNQKENDALLLAADPPNYTNLLPLSLLNDRALELEKFRQEIDKWKRWKHYHQDQSWIRAMKDLVDENSPFLEVLPDSMIPIRGLVKSLIYTCKKAADFALAKEEVFLFVQEIDRWLDIVCAFDSSGDVKSEVWKVLDEIRQLIGDVIRWSSGLQIVSSQWLYVQSQIQAYRQGFTEISTRFGVISGIKLLQGLENVAYGLSYVTHGMNTIAQGVNNVADMITEDNDNVKRTEFLKQRLQPRLIVNASYNDQKKQPCDPETRVKILEDIMTWIKDVSEDSQRFYWLSGAPGVGKSAITASVAKECQDLGILGSQFFINRNDAATTDPRTLLPTICWQLCERFPRTVAVAMEKILHDKPSIIDEISDDQATHLFVKAIEAAGDRNGSRAVVIVIDALDETDPKPLWYLAQILSKVLADLPRYAKVFISSRTEDAITKPFNPLCHHIRVKSRYLAARESIEEVSQFMKKKLDDILRRYDINWADWGDNRMKKLSSQASGLYVWAETALKFLQTEIDSSGTACVGELLNLLTANGMDDLDKLYSGILQRICKNLHGDWEYQRFRRIIGAIIVRQAPLSIADIGQLLVLKDPVFGRPVDLVHFVRQYRTVLVNDTRDINDGVVPSVHRSFADFITSERAKEFRVDKSESHGELALRCIDRLDNLVEYLKSDREPHVSFPRQLVYASLYWRSHLTRVVEPDTNNDMDEKDAYDTSEIPEHDTQSFTANPYGAKDLKPDKKKALSSFAFSPDGAQIASTFGKTIQLWDARTGLLTSTMPLVGHDDHVTSIGFSPDGTQLVSGSVDGKAILWDARTRNQLHILRGHTPSVFYVGFSHDGRILVTCSVDETIRTWSTITGQQLNMFKGHNNPVMYCTFSQDDQRIASRSYNGVVIVWDVNSGNLISKFDHHGRQIIAFSSCGNHVMSRNYDDHTTKLWDVESGIQVEHVNSTVARLAFVEESEQESTSAYIHVPQAPSERVHPSTPRVYTLEMKRGTVCGIVDHGQDVWVSRYHTGRNLFFAAGATRMVYY